MRRKGRKPSEKRIGAAFDELVSLVRQRCVALGGVHAATDTWDGMGSVAMVVPTRLGALWVSGPHRSELLSVFAHFEEPARGAEVGANRYTGKWNYHGASIRDGETAQRAFAGWSLLLDFIKGGSAAEVEAALQASRARSEESSKWYQQEKREGGNP